MSGDEPALKARLEPQRKLISVLFADVRGSTSMVASLDPEDAWALLKPVLSAMKEVVHRFDGVVSKEAGDGIMALFGAPIARDDHAELACRAALALHQEIAGLPGIDLQIRVGVHSGEVILHQLQHDFSSVYDAAGGVVHIAQKLQAGAEPGGTLISGDCHALVKGRFETSPYRGRLPGLDKPIGLFTLRGLRGTSRWESRAELGLSPFVGRDQELRLLCEAAERVSSGVSQQVLIEGEPGAGKSRLVHEFLAESGLRDWEIWRSNAEAMTRQTAWSVARQLLLAALSRNEGADIDAIRDRAVELASVQNEQERLALASLLELPFDRAEWAETTPERRSRLMRGVFARVLLGACARCNGPAALVIEDWQWVDLESREALETLASTGGKASLLILITRRLSDGQALSGEEGLRITLPALAPGEAGLLLRKLLGDAPELESVRRAIIAHTGGVPLFVEEVVRQLVASQYFVKSGGDHLLGKNPLRQLGIPPTVQGVIASRIDQLDHNARALLRIASVLGNGALKADLLAIRDAGTDPSARVFDELEHAALLRLVSALGGEEIVFPHDLIREVAYSGMLRSQRCELHRRTLDHLVAGDTGQSDGKAALLYRHAAGAEDWEKVLAYARRAAAEAIERSAYWNSIEYCDAAIDALSRLPVTEKNVQLEIDLRLEARPAFGATGQLKKLLAYAEDALQRAQSIQDKSRMAAASVQKALALTYIGTPGEMLSAAETALAYALSLRIPQIEAVARYFVGQADYMSGHYRAAADMMAAAFEQLPSSVRLARLGTTGTTAALTKVLEATSLASLGEFEKARQCVDAAAEIAAQTRRPYDEAALAYGSGYSALLQGRVTDAVVIVEPKLSMVKEQDIVFFQPVLGNLMGQAQLAAGRVEDGVRTLQDALHVARELGYGGARIAISLSLGAARMAKGDLAGAEELVGSCLASTRQQGYRGIHANAARYAALLGACQGKDPAAVQSLFEEAIDVGQAIGARPSVAVAQLALAEFLIGLGAKSAASPWLAIVVDAFSQMDMIAFAERARRVARMVD